MPVATVERSMGIKNTVRKKFVPRRDLVSSVAKANANIFIVTTDTTVNFTVNHSASINSPLDVNAVI